MRLGGDLPPVDRFPGFAPATTADTWLAHLLDAVPWRQDAIRIAGRSIPLPRLTCWVGDPDTDYSYSGIRLQPEPWSPVLAEIRDRVGEAAGLSFNSVLLNLYRDGNDSVAWHADDEPELGPTPVIGSLSLGAVRRFQLKRRSGGGLVSLDLGHGELIVMRPPCQRDWLHRIPKQKGLHARSRINLTFRRIAGTGILSQ